MSTTLLRPVEADVHILPCHTRLPFRFGMVTMTRAPLATCRVRLETGPGKVVDGYSSDLLVPKWFEKSPQKSIQEDWRSLLAAQDRAIACLLEGGGATVFDHWHRVYSQLLGGLPRETPDLLVRGEGVCLVERAMIDALCRGAGVDFPRALRAGLLGFDAGRLDPEVSGWDADRLGRSQRRVTVRHTVGLADPIERGDQGEIEDDGLPVSLREDIRTYRLTHFKIKAVSDGRDEVDRLARIWRVIREEAGASARVTLDGNEQFDSVSRLARLLSLIGEDPRFEGFLGSLLLIEQPLARASTFDSEPNRGLAEVTRHAPCIIDEADVGTWAFPEAVSLGYRGVSIKNCKGVFAALLNRARCDASEGRLMQSGEDLTNLPVIALQQDLATMATLGVSHVERNGHHYFRGLDHLPGSEQLAALEAHPDLYTGGPGSARLSIRGGRVALDSVLGAAGFGYAGPVDLGARVAAAGWDPESLMVTGGGVGQP